MTRDDAKTIAKGLLHDGMEPRSLTPAGRQELLDAIERLLDVAGVGLDDMQRLAIQCGNEPYADYKVCPHCSGRGYLASEL
jgi:hypothetical protein